MEEVAGSKLSGLVGVESEGSCLGWEGGDWVWLVYMVAVGL